MKSRNEKMRKIQLESKIKAFTQKDIKECAEGDCDRYFKYNIQNL